MNFVEKEPSKGDHIRVNRGFYYHHGIYIGDDKAIHFGSLTDELNPDDAVVLETSLEEFLKGGKLEVAEYSEEENKKLKSPDEIVSYAKAHLGIKGYDIIKYNCEHFANECIFGEAKSDQVNNIFGLLSKLFR